MAVLVCFMFLFWFFSAKNTNQDLTEYEAYLEKAVGSKIQLGDWVLREGTGYESQLIKQLSGSHYSHIGVVSQVKPRFKSFTRRQMMTLNIQIKSLFPVWLNSPKRSGQTHGPSIGTLL